MNDSFVKIEMHLIQNFAPSNLNRDDTGQPKSATFGGFRRARISSQCSKKSARDFWRKNNTVTVGDRTKKLQELLKATLSAKDNQGAFLWKERSKVNDELLSEGIRVFTNTYYANADKKKPENTSVLIFIGPSEVEVCAQTIKELWNDIGEIIKKGKPADDAKKEDKMPALKPVDEIIKRLKSARSSADIALFGRMLAEQPGRNTDGACQVAHPISTHKVDMEMDFYTAVDDLNPAEQTGAGMMGIVGFNSACYYRYALVDRDQLARNLASKTERTNGDKPGTRKWKDDLVEKDYEEADKVIKAFLEAMIYAIPTGKQNSFAAQNLPAFGLFVRRQGGVPISLANAFAKPVRPTKDDDDLVGLSVDALTKHWSTLKKVYGNQGVKKTPCFHVGQGSRLNELADSAKPNVAETIKEVLKPDEDGKEAG